MIEGQNPSDGHTAVKSHLAENRKEMKSRIREMIC